MATFEWDIVEDKRTWSDGVHSLLGTKPETFTGSAEEFFQVIHPEDRSTVQAALARAVETTGVYETEYRAVWPDGSIHHIAARGKIHRDNAGQAVSMTGVCWDITERKRAEEALQTTMQRFYNVLSGMYAAVLLVKDDGLVEFANQAFCDIFRLKESPVSLNGLTSQEMIAKIKNAYLQPDEAVARIREIVRIGEPVKGEEVAMSGGRTCLRDFIPIVVNGISYGRLWHHLDITERKRAEEELRESEAKYRNLFENITEEVHFWKLVRDASGRITTWRLVDANPPTLKTWGKTLDEIKGKTTDEIFGPGASEHYMPVVRKIMEEGVPYGFEDYFPHLDKYFRFTSVPLGEYFITTGADITSLKKIEQSLRQSREDLDRAQAVGQIGSWRLDVQPQRPDVVRREPSHLRRAQGDTADLRDVPGDRSPRRPPVRGHAVEGGPARRALRHRAPHRGRTGR